MFEKMSKALTRTDIAEIEENLGLEFPEVFVEHYLSYNGGMPTAPYFYSEEEDIETEVQVFPLPMTMEQIRSASIWRTKASILCIWIRKNWTITAFIVLRRVFRTLWKVCPMTV